MFLVEASVRQPSTSKPRRSEHDGWRDPREHGTEAVWKAVWKAVDDLLFVPGRSALVERVQSRCESMVGRSCLVAVRMWPSSSKKHKPDVVYRGWDAENLYHL